MCWSDMREYAMKLLMTKKPTNQPTNKKETLKKAESCVALIHCRILDYPLLYAVVGTFNFFLNGKKGYDRYTI